MVEIAVFHHVMGVTDGVTALADELAAAGHLVHVPDLFEGHRFDSIDEGMAHVESVGFSTILERGAASVADLPGELVYVGVSLGVLPAQHLAMTRAGALGAVLLEACVPPGELGGDWPSAVPVQIHGMADDPNFAGEGDVDHARALVDSLGGGGAELFVYPGDQHLFVDSSLPSYDRDAARRAVERTIEFLARIDAARR